MYCDKCGSSSTGSSAYCNKCGAPFTSDGFSNYGQNDYQNYSNTPSASYSNTSNRSGGEQGKGNAIAALVCGIVSLVLPVPFVDVILGIIGIVMACRAKSLGFSGGLATAGLVLSIIGTVGAVIFTLTCGSILFLGC